MPKLLAQVYRETVVREELIHKVNLGPFTHTVDDGLDARKAAFECLDTGVDTYIDQLDPSTFLEAIVRGKLPVLQPRAPILQMAAEFRDRCACF